MESWAPLVPELLVTDLNSSLRFWCEFIGFSVTYDRPEDKFAYLDLAGAQVMLEQRDDTERQWITGALEKPLGRGINFQIEVTGIDQILARLTEANWPIFMAVEEKWYRIGARETGQRQFLVKDPDGYLLRLVEECGERAAP
jgi:catechol 2,3-dioxygenase-like lactoylglutathione lyase family enzyme